MARNNPLTIRNYYYKKNYLRLVRKHCRYLKTKGVKRKIVDRNARHTPLNIRTRFVPSFVEYFFGKRTTFKGNVLAYYYNNYVRSLKHGLHGKKKRV